MKFRVPGLGRSRSFAILATLALAAAACGPGATPTPASPGGPQGSAAPGAARITIAGFAFGPSTLDVTAGTTVTWTNNDSTAHTVTADDGSFDSKSITPGSTYNQAFAKAGTFTYHCSIHSTMKATITVH